MELNTEKWKNYSTPSIDQNNKRTHDEYWREETLSTSSLVELRDKIDWMIQNAKLNHKDPESVPVFITSNRKRYCLKMVSCGIMECGIEFNSYDELQFTAPDSRPKNGEYWKTRGCGTGRNGEKDCSGFVVSKLAGERIARMVRYILEKDDTVSYLDYRDYEPDWIQYKFSDSEFDVEKLSVLSEKGGIVTMEILIECKR